MFLNATMTVEQCIITGIKETKNGDLLADFIYMGGKDSVKIDKSKKESLPIGKYGTAILQMNSIQSVREFNDNSFISSGWKAEFLAEFKAYK